MLAFVVLVEALYGMLGFFSVFLTGLEHAEAYSAAWAELTAKGVA